VNSNGQVEEMQTESVTGLANMFSDDLEAKAMASKLLEGTPIDDLKEKIKTLKDQIYVDWNDNPFVEGATATLEAGIAEIRSCTAGMENGMRGAEAKKDSCSDKSTSHTTHRKDESTKFTTKEHWKAEKAEKKEMMTTECNAFEAVADEAKSATASYGGGDEGAYLESVSQKFCKDLLPRYREHKEKCTTAKAEHVRVSEIYETKNTAYTVQKTASDTVQSEMDTTCCEYALATKHVCTSHDTCYKDKRAAYENEILPLVKAEEKAKKVEWRVYSRIECLLPILGTSDTHEIEKCRKKTHDTDHLTVPEPNIPDKSACQPEKAFPGTDAYHNTHFGTLPENAKGKNVAECTGLTGDKAPAPYCLLMVTGTANHNDGTLDVHIDAGKGLKKAASGKHAQGSTVVQACFENPVSSVQVKGPTNNAWAGVIKYSTDGWETYSPMMCASGCEGDKHGIDSIVVDGDNDGKGMAATRCLSGSTCTIQAAPACKAKSTSTADAGYGDSYRGWYDVQGCGKCLDYCRWVGNSGSGGNPETKLQHGSSWWSCRLAGDSSAYSGKSHFSAWSHKKCSGEGAAVP